MCGAERATWWFSSDASGRFDLDPPEGTCYLATDSYAAIREATRLGPVSTEWVRAHERRDVEPVDGRARLAATTRLAAGSFGVTNELATIVPYDLPRRWAAAFRAAGFDGIRHVLRHDQRARPSGVALFGPAGAADLPDGRRRALTVADVERAGVTVLPPPLSSALTVVP
ncbi:MAG: RES domain-containing protein [Actinobacteria bacterium]|nr:RES domain-containing protein [Actinomycetota bacterium]